MRRKELEQNKEKREELEIEKINRGKRIKYIREVELQMTKLDLAKQIGISGQFLGRVEEGKGNLVYDSIKRLCKISGHSSDYILFGLDDSTIRETRELLKKYSVTELKHTIKIIKEITMFLKD